MNPELRASIIGAFSQSNITHAFQGDPSDPLDGTRIEVGPFLAVQVYETRPEPIWRFEGQAALIARAAREVLRGVDVVYEETSDDQPNPAIGMVHMLIDHLCADRAFVDTRKVQRADGSPGFDLVIANLYKMKLEGASAAIPVSSDLCGGRWTWPSWTTLRSNTRRANSCPRTGATRSRPSRRHVAQTYGQ